jgi:transposase
MGHKRRRYSAELREEAVRQFGGGASVANVAQTLGVPKGTAQYWRDAGRGSPSPAPSGSASLPADVEVRMLRKEVARLRAEQDFLKKAIAFFARASESGTP